MTEIFSMKKAKTLGYLLFTFSLVGVSGCGGNNTKGTAEDLSRFDKGPSPEDLEQMKKASKGMGAPPPQAATNKP